jgi:hypothetical protein
MTLEHKHGFWTDGLLPVSFVRVSLMHCLRGVAARSVMRFAMRMPTEFGIGVLHREAVVRAMKIFILKTPILRLESDIQTLLLLKAPTKFKERAKEPSSLS